MINRSIRLTKLKYGFTLIEMLVALAIFATAASALVIANGQAVEQADALQTKVLASWLAANQMNYLQATKAWPAVDKYTLSKHFAKRDWTLSQEVKTSNNRLLRQVIIRVYKDGQGNKADSNSVYQLIGYIRADKKPSQ